MATESTLMNKAKKKKEQPQAGGRYIKKLHI